MKNAFTSAAVVLVLIGFAASTAQAKGPKPKHTPAHDAAVQKCGDVYEATAAAIHAPNGPTGGARLRAMHAAAEAKKHCIATAPK